MDEQIPIDNQTTTRKKYDRVIKLNIILCWVFLIICFIIKLLGGSFFNVGTENKRFIELCNFIDKYLQIPVQILFYFINGWLYFCGCFRIIKPKWKDVIVILSTLTALCVLKQFSLIAGTIVECVAMILIPIAYKKTKWYMSILYCALYNIFGFISAFTKNITNLKLSNNTLIGVLFSIDVFFMLSLFMFYNYKKEE